MNAEIRLDTFIDPALVKKVEGIVREMMKEKGFQFAEVTHEITEVAGGPKLVNLIFNMNEGPKVKIRKIDVRRQQRGQRRHAEEADEEQQGTVSSCPFLNGRGTYQEAKFEEDADRVMQFYLDRGIHQGAGRRRRSSSASRFGGQEDPVGRAADSRSPEGTRYRVGNFDFDGNTVVKTERCRPLFKLNDGRILQPEGNPQGLREGAGGVRRRRATWSSPAIPTQAARRAEPCRAGGAGGARRRPQKPAGPPIVDVTMRIQEGKQYFVNRIMFVGNTTTRDNVIRREMRLYENGVFNSEALKYSIRRLNQLGYFKALEGPPQGRRRSTRRPARTTKSTSGCSSRSRTATS